jgi:hypothetical protein
MAFRRETPQLVGVLDPLADVCEAIKTNRPRVQSNHPAITGY